MYMYMYEFHEDFRNSFKIITSTCSSLTLGNMSEGHLPTCNKSFKGAAFTHCFQDPTCI